MRIVVWLIRAFIFFTLFAFALNNQQATTLHLFFGVQWQAPMVIIVLVFFAAGCVVGVLAMLPDLWRRWRLNRALTPPVTPAPAVVSAASIVPSEFGNEPHPPRLGT